MDDNVFLPEKENQMEKIRKLIEKEKQAEEEARKSLKYFDKTEPILENYLLSKGKYCSSCPFFNGCYRGGLYPSSHDEEVNGYHVDSYLFRCPIGDVGYFFSINAEKIGLHHSSNDTDDYKQTEAWKKWEAWLQKEEEKLKNMIEERKSRIGTHIKLIASGYPSCFGEQRRMASVGHGTRCPVDCKFLRECRTCDGC